MTTTPPTPLTDAVFAALVETEGKPEPQCITCLDTGHYSMVDGGHFCSCVCGPIAETYSKIRRAAMRREDTLRAQLAQARAEVERLREALTPSVGTKTAYIGEFKFHVAIFDKDGDEYVVEADVPWPTIKDIMAVIKARAALAG